LFVNILKKLTYRRFN